MKLLGVIFLFCYMIPTLALARMGGDGSTDRYRVSGFYGLGSVSPSDINNYLTQQAGTPKLGSLSSSINYGGELGIMVSPRWEIELGYDSQDSKNPTNITSPTVSNAGVELQQNTFWGGLNFYLVDSGRVHAYVGASAGYPTYAHAIVTYTTNSAYDAARQAVFQGKAGLDFILTRHLSIFFEGGYQSMTQGVLSNGSTNLAYTGNPGAKMDLSGGRGQAGLTIHF